MPPEKTPPILIDLPDALHGPRVLVRHLKAGDGAALWEAIEESREHIAPWMPWGVLHQTPADSEAYARRCHAKWILRDELGVGIWDRTSGRFLGGSGFIGIDWDVPAFEIGYWLRRSAVGQGYVTEAVRLLCRMAFETLSVNRLMIRCDTGNERSIAVARRLGFIQESVARNESRGTSGELRDLALFVMTPDEYARAVHDANL